MELEQIMRYSDVFVGVMITLETIVFIVNAALKLIGGKYYNTNLKKYTDLLDDTIGVIDKPTTIILWTWFIIKIGTAFIK